MVTMSGEGDQTKGGASEALIDESAKSSTDRFPIRRILAPGSANPQAEDGWSVTYRVLTTRRRVSRASLAPPGYVTVPYPQPARLAIPFRHSPCLTTTCTITTASWRERTLPNQGRIARIG